ncbi:hypothetical protein YC2023_101441 [Brassica napus]
MLLCWYESAARARIIIGDGICLRLSDESTSEALAVRRLLGHRLPTDAHKAKKDWYLYNDSLLRLRFLATVWSSL